MNCAYCHQLIHRKYFHKTAKNYFCSNQHRYLFMQKYKDGDSKIVKWGKFSYRYIYIEKIKKFILEHRLVMEKKLKRKLLKTDIVHHINQDTLDNRIENLRVYESHNHHLLAHNRTSSGEEALLRQSDILDYLNDAFGVEKIIQLFVEKQIRNPKYGIPVIKNIKSIKIGKGDHIDDVLRPSSFVEHKVNCLTYSKFYLQRQYWKNKFKLAVYG